MLRQDQLVVAAVNETKIALQIAIAQCASFEEKAAEEKCRKMVSIR